jgi:hypothetical protein
MKVVVKGPRLSDRIDVGVGLFVVCGGRLCAIISWRPIFRTRGVGKAVEYEVMLKAKWCV